MNELAPALFNQKNKPILRALALFLIIFFLIMTLLTAFIAVPEINKSLEDQHISDGKITLEIERELLKRFVANHRTILEDLAKFPVVTSATLLNDANNPDFIDLVDNFLIAGRTSRVILQDINGQIIYQTTQDLTGNFLSNAPWIKEIIEGKSSYNFQLLEQEGDDFRFVISIPVFYRGNIEGILSAEITAPIIAMFSPQTLKDGSAFRLRQNDIVVQMNIGDIPLPREISTQIVEENLELTYVSDDTGILKQQHKLGNTILAVLFIGLAISFLLFTLLGYRALTDTEEDKDARTSLFERTYLLPMIIGIIGVAATLSASLIFQDQHNQKLQQKILANNSAQILSIEQALESNTQILGALKSFFDSSTYVDRKEFKAFVAPLLENNKNTQGLEWIPSVAHSERDKYVEQARKEGLHNFEITERNLNGDLITAQTREQYFPVYYLEPFTGNEKALGFDLGSDPKRLAGLQRASETGRIVATKHIRLIQDGTAQADILVFNPIYNKGHFARDFDDTEDKHLKGFVLSIVRVGNLIQSALKNEINKKNIWVQDITDPNSPTTIFGSFNEAIQTDFISHHTLDFAGRIWRITAFPNAIKHQSLLSPIPLAILFSGFVFTFLITYTLIQLIRRRQVIERLVDKRTEEIKNSKQFQDLIMSNIPDLLFVKDEEFRIIEANPAFLNVYPEDVRDKIIGTNSFEKYDPDEAEEFLYFDRLALKEGHSQTEETIQFPDGKIRTLFTKKVRFENMEGERFILGIGHDITDKKEAEQEILRSNIELERFAYVASHDLQEPLRMVTNFTGLLEQDYGDSLDDTAKQYINFAANSARRMQALVNDLLEYARIGQEAENFKDVNLNKIMALVEENLKDSIGSTGATITYDNLPVVYANPIRLMRVLQNLIGNSIKYQERGAKPKIHIHARDNDGFWEFSIKDNGIGMKQDYCEQIFEPFKRLHAKNEYNGTGMGLAICRKIIEGFGGKIWAKSVPGGGSTFFFTMALRDKNKSKINDMKETKEP